MKKTVDPEADISPLYGTKRRDIEREEIEPGEDPLQFPGDLRPEWERENNDITDKKPDLEEIDEDPNRIGG